MHDCSFFYIKERIALFVKNNKSESSLEVSLQKGAKPTLKKIKSLLKKRANRSCVQQSEKGDLLISLGPFDTVICLGLVGGWGVGVVRIL